MNFIQTEAKQWTIRNFPNAIPSQAILGIVEELGELSHQHLKAEQGIRETSPEKAKDAIGDMIIYIMHYCNLMGWDLDKIIFDTWDIVKKRDWIKYPKNGKTD